LPIPAKLPGTTAAVVLKSAAAGIRKARHLPAGQVIFSRAWRAKSKPLVNPGIVESFSLQGLDESYTLVITWS
jgi:hypothetical protein